MKQFTADIFYSKDFDDHVVRIDNTYIVTGTKKEKAKLQRLARELNAVIKRYCEKPKKKIK